MKCINQELRRHKIYTFLGVTLQNNVKLDALNFFIRDINIFCCLDSFPYLMYEFCLDVLITVSHCPLSTVPYKTKRV